MYKSAITEDKDGSFFTLVFRVDNDGEEFVCRSYNGRHFKSEKAALRSTQKHIAKLDV